MSQIEAKPMKQVESESASVEYKRTFKSSSTGAWCELLKDVVAIANSGGGEIIFGVDDDGNHAVSENECVPTLDPVRFSDKLAKYSSSSPPDFKVQSRSEIGNGVWALRIGPVAYPVIFDRDGSYDKGLGRPAIAFRQGCVYVRTAGKSAPARSLDLREVIDRLVEVRNKNLRKVIEAPLDAELVVGLSSEYARVGTGTGPLPSVNLTDDPNATKVYLDDEAVKKNYPYDYQALTKALKGIVSGFKQNSVFHQAKKTVEDDPNYCYTRYLNPSSKGSSKKRLYSEAALQKIAELTSDSFSSM